MFLRMPASKLPHQLNSNLTQIQLHKRIYEVLSTKNRTIALVCAILITETFWILENFPWVMQTKTEQNGFFPTLIVIAQSLLETTPYPLPLPRFHSFLLMPKEPKSTNSSPPSGGVRKKNPIAHLIAHTCCALAYIKIAYIAHPKCKIAHHSAPKKNIPFLLHLELLLIIWSPSRI